jgi:hypothetical protein
MILGLIEDQTVINEQGVCQILDEYLGKRKICMHCVAHSHTDKLILH